MDLHQSAASGRRFTRNRRDSWELAQHAITCSPSALQLVQSNLSTERRSYQTENISCTAWTSSQHQRRSSISFTSQETEARWLRETFSWFPDNFLTNQWIDWLRKKRENKKSNKIFLICNLFLNIYLRHPRHLFISQNSYYCIIYKWIFNYATLLYKYPFIYWLYLKEKPISK